MKKTFFLLLTFLVILPIFKVEAVVQGEKRMFTITGYYSPLPDQDFYITGSYESEIRLNGNGIQGADSTLVYPGIMAAPSNYEFNTKVCVPGFGCGAVHDRGQAIVTKGKRDLAKNDRLDLWMGYGDNGLLRALAWGVKHLECEVYQPDEAIAESVNFDVPLALFNLIKMPKKLLFSKNISRGSIGNEVIKLQKALSNLGFYTGIIDGVFDFDTEESVFKFQKASFILETKKTLGAGIFGPQTRKKMADAIQRLEIQKEISEMWESFHFDENLSLGQRNGAVLKLQQILVENEFLDVQPTGFFGSKTEAALIEFQKLHSLITTEESLGAGKVGPATREKLNEILNIKKEFYATEKKQILAFQSLRQKFQYLAQKNVSNTFVKK
jgi:peptidoglycan hydrolase-like protein with peptidoglycan-binding domain